jgi:hypothetical protein
MTGPVFPEDTWVEVRYPLIREQEWLCQPDVDPPEYFDLAPPGSMRGGVVAL